uniref:Chitin-binding type-2 domain-containing protein n=2 Tax=Photinus pyralis TaxID=7054 RepID=A0A1Y1L861_PHOPY
MALFAVFVLLMLTSFGTSLGQRKLGRNVPVGADVKKSLNFDCPEEFGYYPHPADCTQYYVCVFGGALLESCTGGLMYSHELQTCDWPRNVGCDGTGDVVTTPSVAYVSSTPSRSADSKIRYSHPPPPPPIPPQPAAVVTSRGQPRQLQHSQQELIKQKQQQQLYVDADDTLSPAEEIESDRQQRVYRGQPSTVGQVQRDRDGLRQHTNAIPLSSGRGEKISIISFSGQQQQQPIQQYRIENKGNRAIEQTLSTVPPKTIYNNSNNYDSSRYDSYYALYDDDVDIYKDVEYAQHYNNEPTPKQVYRGTPATVTHEVIQQEKSPKISNSGYIQNTYSASDDIYQPADVQSYSDDVSYGTQDDERTVYHQTSKQTNRGDRNELNYIEESATTKRITTTTTTTPASTPREYSTQKNIRNPARVTNNRGRGSAHYTTSGRNDNSVNRGTPPSRSRPTLKPSTSVVAKAAEFIDIYKYPPRRPEPIYPQPLPDKTAAKCRKDVCLLPDCSCGGKEIPGDLPVEQVPQMVLLTYDDSVNDLNKGLYSDLFEKGRVNPNGCPIAATFYVSHEWTDYSQVQNLYSDGHEIASHTVSHSFGEQFSQKKWTKEVAGQREILSAYGGVHLEDVRGMRAPFLSVGGNKMFKMLYDSNFTFDSSMPIYENKPPSWPYTLDYKLFHDCMIPPCPTRSYPGVWEVPMVMWQDLNGGRCSMGDACSNPSDAEGVYKMIMKNFERHYTSNRAPFGLFYHAAWFTQPHHKEGFIQFLDAINSMKDVWLVTNWQAIQWVRDPTPTSRLNSFQPFGCNYPDRPKRCNNPKVCNLWHKTGVRYMRTCQPCPDIYPWTGNTGIHSSRIDNDLEE